MIRCRTCDRELGEVRAVKQRWVAVCPGCADRNEVRCPSCRGVLEDARDRPALEAFCVRCDRLARISDGEVRLREPSQAVTSAATTVVGGHTPLRSVGRWLRVGRGKPRVKDAAFRASGRAWELELVRGAHPEHENPADAAKTMTLAGVALGLLLLLLYLIGFGPQGPGSATTPLAFAGAVAVAFALLGGMGALLASLRERARAARGLYRAARVRVSEEGLHVDDAPPIAPERVQRLLVTRRDGDHAVRVRLDDDERVLLDGLEEAEAELVVREVRAALGHTGPR